MTAPSGMTKAQMTSAENLQALRALSTQDLNVRISLLEQVASDNYGDPRLTMDGGINDQIEVLRGIRAERIPPSVVGLATLDLRVERQ